MVKADAPQLRMVDTPRGPLTYALTRKRVKNLNLRVGAGGDVTVSLPLRCPVKQADDFVRAKSGWILDAVARRAERQAEPLPPVSREDQARLLREALTRMYPLVSPLGVAFPELKLRKLKSQWGNCHWAQGYITLNTALAAEDAESIRRRAGAVTVIVRRGRSNPSDSHARLRRARNDRFIRKV